MSYVASGKVKATDTKGNYVRSKDPWINGLARDLYALQVEEYAITIGFFEFSTIFLIKIHLYEIFK